MRPGWLELLSPPDKNKIPLRTTRGPGDDQQVDVGVVQGARGELEVRQCRQATGVRDRIQEQVEQGKPAGC